MKLVIAGGGTGGHLFPGVAIAESLLELDARNEVLFVGTERGIEVRAVPKAGFRLALIDIAGLKRKSLVQRITTLGRLPGSLLQSRRVLREFRADAVIGVGGYASGPVVVAAWLMGLPTAIHEQNSVPGVTNKILSRLVRKVFVTFAASLPHFPAQKTSLVGNPVRRTFREAAARPAGPFEEGLVFIFGGSQGARPLNETAPSALRLLQDEGLKVRALHQAGNDAVAGVEAAYREAGVQATVTSFIDEMVEAYRRAHVVILSLIHIFDTRHFES